MTSCPAPFPLPTVDPWIAPGLGSSRVTICISVTLRDVRSRERARTFEGSFLSRRTAPIEFNVATLANGLVGSGSRARSTGVARSHLDDMIGNCIHFDRPRLRHQHRAANVDPAVSEVAVRLHGEGHARLKDYFLISCGLWWNWRVTARTREILHSKC